MYQGAFWIYKRANFNPLLNPVPISVAVLVVILTVTNTPYQTYFDGAQFVHFLLGPATVALAVPLYPQLGKLRRAVIPVIGALLAGGVVAAGSAVGIARAFQVSEEAGAFARVAMALTALASSILFPLLLWVFTP